MTAVKKEKHKMKKKTKFDHIADRNNTPILNIFFKICFLLNRWVIDETDRK